MDTLSPSEASHTMNRTSFDRSFPSEDLSTSMVERRRYCKENHSHSKTPSSYFRIQQVTTPLTWPSAHRMHSLADFRVRGIPYPSRASPLRGIDMPQLSSPNCSSTATLFLSSQSQTLCLSHRGNSLSLPVNDVCSPGYVICLRSDSSSSLLESGEHIFRDLEIQFLPLSTILK